MIIDKVVTKKRIERVNIYGENEELGRGEISRLFLKVKR